MELNEESLLWYLADQASTLLQINTLRKDAKPNMGGGGCPAEGCMVPTPFLIQSQSLPCCDLLCKLPAASL